MLDKEAIKHIQDTANTEKFIDSINSKSDFPTALIPSGYQLEDLEKYREHRNQLRASYIAGNLDDFSLYAKQNEEKGSLCFIDPDEMKAKIFFDVGTKELPLHKKHTSSLTEQMTAEFEALRKIVDRRQSQKELAEFIEDWSENITVFAVNGEVLTASKASASIRGLTYEKTQGLTSQVDDFNSSRSVYETEAAKTKGDLPMIAKIAFTCVPYVDLDEYAFQCRFNVYSDNDVSLSSIRYDLIKQEMAKAFSGKVIDSLSTQGCSEIGVYVGTYA